MSLLDKYPLEVKQTIFSYLSPGDVQHLINDPNLGQLALTRRYSSILLDTTSGKSTVIESQKSQTSIPARLLPALYRKHKFEPVLLRFENVLGFCSFLEWQPELVAKFIRIEHVGSLGLTLDELHNLPSLPNLTALVVTSSKVVNRSSVPLPEGLRQLRTTNVSFDVYPTSLAELHIKHADDFDHMSFPRTLKKLVIESGTLLGDLLASLPKTLLSLDLLESRFCEPRIIDLATHPTLQHLHIDRIPYADLKLPQSIVSVSYKRYIIQNFQALTKFPKLTSLSLTSCTIARSALNCDYPESLKEILLEDVSMEAFSNQLVQSWDTPNVFDFKVPSRLRSFTLRQKDNSKLFVHTDILKHDSLRNLELKVDGIYYDFDPEEEVEPNFKSLRGVEFGENLERLVLGGADFATENERIFKVKEIFIQGKDDDGIRMPKWSKLDMNAKRITSV